MIDIKLIRESPEIVKNNIAKKFRDDKLVLVDKALNLDEQWKKIKNDEEGLRSERNKVSEKINQLMKSGKKKEADGFIKSAKKIPAEIEKLETKRKNLETKLQEILSSIPNIMSKRVPSGKDDSENIVEATYGKPEKFSFPVKSHAEIAEGLGLADFESSGRVSGSGFYYLEGDLALLNQALIRFAIDKMVKKKFVYVETPLMLKNEVINSVTDLNDQEMMIYRIGNDDV